MKSPKIKERTILEDLYEKTGGGDHNELSKIETTELLKVLNDEKKHHLENKTWTNINNQLLNILTTEFPNNKKYQKQIYKILENEYIYVDEIHQLDKGKFIRWIRDDGLLTNGGFVCDITTGIEDIIILCKNSLNRFVRYNFNKNITFQKLSISEKIILEVKEFILDDTQKNS